MTAARWKPFPSPDACFHCPGPVLKQRWTRLHEGDCEAFPEAAFLEALITRHSALEPAVPLKKAGEILQDAWRAFHCGDFAEAVRVGLVHRTSRVQRSQQGK